MTLVTSTLRPGLLVSLKTSLRGNVKYERVDLENDKYEKQTMAKWETTRVIADAAEHDRACKARTKARVAVSRVCSASAFGLLCPEANADILEEAIAEARRIVDEFNSTAELTRIHVYVIAGKVASDDVEAVKAINSEVRELMDEMARGVEKMDVSAIRDAANKARDVGKMLTPQAQANVQLAIDAARGAAKDIVKLGDTAALEVDTLAIRQIREQRTMFLDLSESEGVAAPKAKGRRVEIDPDAKRASDEYIANALANEPAGGFTPPEDM